MRVTFTEQRVRAFAAPTKDGPERLEYRDTGCPNLVLRVGRTGSRTYALRFHHNGRERIKTIKNADQIGLADARKVARALLAATAAGKDIQREGILFKVALRDFEKLYLKRNNLRSADEVSRMLRRHVLPKLGNKFVHELAKRDVFRITDKLIDQKKLATANYIHSSLRSFFTFCVDRDLIAASPMLGMKRPAKIEARKRVLGPEELWAVWKATGGPVTAHSTIVRLLMLTLARRDEVAGARWDEFNGDQTVWTIPGTRTKNKQQHVIPISMLAREILIRWYGATHDHNSEFVFPSRGWRGESFSGFSKAKKELDQAIRAKFMLLKPWRLHDLRRSGATYLEEQNVPPRVIQKLLNHKSGGGVTAVGEIYLRAQHEDALRAAVRRLADQFEHFS